MILNISYCTFNTFYIMARQIKETTILTGEEAEKFVTEMQRIDNLSKETRIANKKKLLNDFKAIVQKITICL